MDLFHKLFFSFLENYTFAGNKIVKVRTLSYENYARIMRQEWIKLYIRCAMTHYFNRKSCSVEQFKTWEQ